MRGKHFKPENTFEKGIFAWARTADANYPCTELKGLYFNMVVNENLKACFWPSPRQVSLVQYFWRRNSIKLASRTEFQSKTQP